MKVNERLGRVLDALTEDEELSRKKHLLFISGGHLADFISYAEHLPHPLTVKDIDNYCEYVFNDYMNALGHDEAHRHKLRAKFSFLRQES